VSDRDPNECSQPDCDSPAAFRYTWPGRDEARVCLMCSARVSALASWLSLHLQFIPLTADDYLRGEGGV